MAMKVKQLIELLSRYDDDATVFIAEQPRWPLENHIIGVASRKECEELDGPCRSGFGEALNDVFLVEGEQRGYGERAAWDVVRRSRTWEADGR